MSERVNWPDLIDSYLGTSCPCCHRPAAPLPDGDKVNCGSCGIVEKVLTATEKNRAEAQRDYPGAHEFVHLHNHTLYSSLDGVATPEEYMSGCEECGQPAFAITDHGNMASFPDAYFSAKKHKIKFIPGMEAYFNDHGDDFETWRENGGIVSDQENRIVKGKNALRQFNKKLYDKFYRNRHITLLAKNEIGYHNMLKMNYESWQSGEQRLNFDTLKKYKEGIIVLSGCLNGPVCSYLRSNDELDYASGTIRKRMRTDREGRANPIQIGIEWIKVLQEEFGDDFYLEMQMPGDKIENGKKAFNLVNKISEKMGIKALLTNDCHYMTRQEFESQIIMMAVSQSSRGNKTIKIDSPDLFHVNSDDQFFKTRAELRKTFIENGYKKFAPIDRFENLCDTTLEVAEKCDNFKPDLTAKLPEVEDADRELIRRCYKELKRLGLSNDEKYQNQLNTELKRFIEKGFSSYFLITQDLVQYSRKDLEMPIGPARGSAGGSLVCYLLGITTLDPIKWGLSFDRFLSPSRGGTSMTVSME